MAGSQRLPEIDRLLALTGRPRLTAMRPQRPAAALHPAQEIHRPPTLLALPERTPMPELMARPL